MLFEFHEHSEANIFFGQTWERWYKKNSIQLKKIQFWNCRSCKAKEKARQIENWNFLESFLNCLRTRKNLVVWKSYKHQKWLFSISFHSWVTNALFVIFGAKIGLNLLQSGFIKLTRYIIFQLAYVHSSWVRGYYR